MEILEMAAEITIPITVIFVVLRLVRVLSCRSWKWNFLLPILFIMAFCTLCWIMRNQTNYKMSQSDECMRFIEKKHGLARFQNKIQEKFQEKFQTQKSSSNPVWEKGFFRDSLEFNPKNQTGTYNWSFRNAGRVKLYGIGMVYPSELEPEKSRTTWIFTKWRKNMAHFDCGLNNYKMIFEFFIFIPASLFVIAAACLRFNLRYHVFLVLMTVILAGIAFCCYPGDNSIFRLFTVEGKINELKELAAQGKLAELFTRPTLLIPEGSADNPMQGELLIGGKDAFDENFLSWQLADNIFLYYFAQTHNGKEITGEWAECYSEDQKIFLVKYSSDIQLNLWRWIVYLVIIVSCLGVIWYYNLLYRRKTRNN